MNLRLCDLNLHLQNSPLQDRICRLREELRRRGLRFRPHFWLSSEWFTPDGVPGIAIPFYLAHPRLMRLENRQMLEVEGGSRRWCMRILRHEAGHAIDNAYRLHRRKTWQKLFGNAAQTYPDYYQPKPHSRRFVMHLDYWYAQSHPSEDFAETFAVWLTPGSQWRQRYRGWSALKKLEYVDALMNEIARKPPTVRTRRQVEPLSELRVTLRKHYEEKRDRYGTDYPDFYDRDLRQLFSDPMSFASRQDQLPAAAQPRSSARRSVPRGDDGAGRAKGQSAAAFLEKIRPDVRRLVSNWTGEYQYTIDQLLLEMILRCEELDLKMERTEKEVKTDATVMLTVQTMNYLHSGRHRLVL